MDVIFATLLLIVLSRIIIVKDGGMFHRILLFGLGIRLFLLICSCTDILPVPDAHGDAENFHDFAKNHPNFFADEDYHLTNYTRFLSVLYLMTDDSRWFAQFLNVFLGIMMLVYLRRILCVLNIQKDVIKQIMLIAVLMPFLNVYSVVLMREAWVSFFVVVSLYYFICWYLQIGKGGVQITKSLLAIILAMWMHAGVVGLLFGYFVAFTTYYRSEDKIRISKSSYIALFFIAVFVVIMILNINALFSKFNVEDFGNYAEAKSAGEGGDSDYLTWLDLSSPQKILMYTPLKMFYFLYSPIIIDWRGLNDLAAFLLDSSIYIFLSWYIITKKVVLPKYRLLKRYLFVSILFTTFLFSFGTSNTGTAIRHRAKICTVMLIAASVSMKKKHQDSMKKELI